MPRFFFREDLLTSSDGNYGILKMPTGEQQVAELSIWSELEEREIKLSQYYPPENYFQEMIQWTEQGKIWQFPIDNEQGKLNLKKNVVSWPIF